MAAVCVAGGDECVGVSEGRLAAAGRGACRSILLPGRLAGKCHLQAVTSGSLSMRAILSGKAGCGLVEEDCRLVLFGFGWRRFALGGFSLERRLCCRVRNPCHRTRKPCRRAHILQRCLPMPCWWVQILCQRVCKLLWAIDKRCFHAYIVCRWLCIRC